MSARSDFQKAVQRYGAEYQNLQTVRLGRLDGVTVATETAGVLWARQWNGREIQVINRALVPSDFDLRVLVGTYRTQPNKWFILQTMEDYLTPAAGGRIAYHHEQHEFPNPDTVWVNRKQLTSFSVIVQDAASFIVQVYGGTAVTPNGVKMLANQLLDVSGEIPAFGAVYVNIEMDDDLALTLHAGTNFGSPPAGGPSYIATPDPGKYILAYVLLFEGQTQLLDEQIVVPTPIGMLPRSTGLQISEAAADTPADGDKWGFWDIVDLTLKSITWANIKATLKTYFDTLYATPDASIVTYTPADPADWTGGVDPGNADDALDQLASRMVVAEAGIGRYRQFVYEVSGGDLIFLTDEDGNPLFNLEDLE